MTTIEPLIGAMILCALDDLSHPKRQPKAPDWKAYAANQEHIAKLQAREREAALARKAKVKAHNRLILTGQIEPLSPEEKAFVEACKAYAASELRASGTVITLHELT